MDDSSTISQLTCIHPIGVIFGEKFTVYAETESICHADISVSVE